MLAVHKRPIHLLATVTLLAVITLSNQLLASEQVVQQGSSSLRVQLSDEFSARSQRELTDWVDELSRALLQVYGRWPRADWRIEVRPASAAGNDPIPWAQVDRGAVDTVEFYVATTATAAQLLRNWTGYHELSHLLLPYRGWGDLWFSEGLATYYQNILQVRSGTISPEQMWKNLEDGLMRGRNDSRTDGRALHRVSRELRDNRAYMRVYWSGTWYFLQADLQLRQQSRGRRSLDQALDGLNRCCGNRAMSVIEIVRKLDELEHTRLFEPLYRQLAASTSMPQFEPTLAALGLGVDASELAPALADSQRALRDAITAPL